MHHPVRDVKRIEHIFSVLAKHGMRWVLEHSRLVPISKDSKQKSITPEKLPQLFEELGGAFPKLGQLLSLRPDLIPIEYCDALSALQDRMKPVAWSLTKKAIEKELGMPIHEVFKSFSETPIAAASIGQVHEAKMKNGMKVAVKVQRPGIREVIDTDIEILEYLAEKISPHINTKIADPVQIVREFKEYTANELDYQREARNIVSFRQNFKERNITIPTVIDKYSTSRLLVMSFVEGQKVTLLKSKTARARAASALVHAELQSIFIDGLFHADPHPGNVLIDNGKLALLDFGIVGYLSDSMKEMQGRVLISLLTRNVDELAEALSELGVSRAKDMESLKTDLRNSLGKYYDVSLNHMHMGQMLSDAMRTARRNDIILPKNYVLLLKATLTLEGTGRVLNPDFNFVREAHPFVKELIASRVNPESVFKRFFGTAKKWERFAQTFPEKADHLFTLAEHSEEAVIALNKDLTVLTSEIKLVSGRLILGVLAGAFVIAGALVVNVGPRAVQGLSVVSIACFVLAGIMVAVITLSTLRDRR
ncbi:MAG: AarF/ABC1/UbiB kinase family protein [Candidatus Woesearchaeota archaeon]